MDEFIVKKRYQLQREITKKNLNQEGKSKKIFRTHKVSLTRNFGASTLISLKLIISSGTCFVDTYSCSINL